MKERCERNMYVKYQTNWEHGYGDLGITGVRVKKIYIII